jgi:ubiquinone/menaquinone biosynthesis C-methylase UbiE
MRWPAWVRRAYMRTTSPSSVGSGNRAYVRWMYVVWSKFYDFSIGLDPAFRDGARVMVDAVVTQGDRTLDVGIGTGILAELGATRASEWVGLDYSESMLRRAERKIGRLGLERVSLRQGDARHLPYEDGSFDAVVSSFMLPHMAVPEKPEVLREMARVLRPGGRLGLYLAQGEEAPLFSTHEQLQRWLPAVGFTNVAIEDRDDVYRIVTATLPEL